jgi:phosphatidylserine/phosphatidylglycerophosphate/cardiolipin synthase-like enzyme
VRSTLALGFVFVAAVTAGAAGITAADTAGTTLSGPGPGSGPDDRLAGPGSDPAAGAPAVVAAYPNPVAADDAGEFVVLSVPPGTDLGTFAVGDGEARVRLPNVTAGGRVTLSTDPDATRALLDRRVYPLSDRLQLANGGERIRLYHGARVVDSLAYEDAPGGDLRVRDGDRPWRPLGATNREVVAAGEGRVTAFLLPDAPDVAVDHLRSAEERVLLAGYTFTSGRAADALVAAARRNVSVRVLVDGDPVGGMTDRQAAILDRLARAGIDVRVLGGDRARYRFHHAKYAVVDGRVLVTTENWKPAGLGGNGSRGWGVVTTQPRVVDGLVETFRADASWQDAQPWQEVRDSREFVAAEPPNSTYPSRFEPARVPVEGARLLVAPDNAEPVIRAAIAGANESLAIEQVTLGGRAQPFVRETLDAARRGVRVRVLLAGAWYVREDNERLVAWLNRRAEVEDLPLEARVADPRGRFEKIHAKGVVVDGDCVLLGSVNWNNNSVRHNREVVLVLEGAEVGAYYRRAFEADWRGGARRLPAGVVVVLLVGVAAALLGARRIRFEE